MRNFFTLVALLLSGTGIFVSLAREELRCHLGLNSPACLTQEIDSPPSSAKKTRDDSPTATDSESPSTVQIPGAKQLQETVEAVRETVTEKTQNADTPDENEPLEISSPPAEGKSPSQTKPSTNLPLTSQEQKVNTAAINEAAPKKAEPEAPIAPPAQKNESAKNVIPVTPAEGQPIPVIAPPDQE